MAIQAVVDCLFSPETLPIAASQAEFISCGQTAAGLLHGMDENGIAQVLLVACRQWNCDRHWTCADGHTEELLHYVRSAPSRFCALANYNPHAIAESLEQFEISVKNWGFRGVYVHTDGADVGLRGREMYPLYAKCNDLAVPVVVQAGCHGTHLADLHELTHIATDFPTLKIVAACSGSMDLRQLLVVAEHDVETPDHDKQMYFSFSGAPDDITMNNLCTLLSSDLMHHRCMWASNSTPWAPLLKHLRTLPLAEPLINDFIRNNAHRVFDLGREHPSAGTEAGVAIAER